jgi:hypothetical protein
VLAAGSACFGCIVAWLHLLSRFLESPVAVEEAFEHERNEFGDRFRLARLPYWQRPETNETFFQDFRKTPETPRA